MSTHTDPDAVPTVECPVCRTDVPAGAFCGLCGADLTREPGAGAQWLRPATFGAAPGESVLRPSIASSLFPHLPNRSRTPFRVGLVLVVAGLVGFALLRLPAGLITVSALGLPLLFLLYLGESDVYRDMPRHALLVAGVLGVGLGVGWVLLTGEMVARSYGIPMAAGIAVHRLLREGIGVPVGGAALMILPAVVVRLLRIPTREALDGFAIGALGALAFAAGATMTRLAPQFTTGMIAHSRPMKGLLVEAGICGLTIPLTAAVAGGLMGLALWFSRPADKVDQHPWRVRATLAAFALAVVTIFVAVGVIDVIGLPQSAMMVLHIAMTVVALVTLRTAIQLALLHEAHDPIYGDPLLCVHCEHVVPDMAFCPACGAATRASSRTSRRKRREARPVRTVAAEGP